MLVILPITHIRREGRGVAWIDETRVKVIEVVQDWLAHGSGPEEVHREYPHLSLAQIHAAMAYCNTSSRQGAICIRRAEPVQLSRLSV